MNKLLLTVAVVASAVGTLAGDLPWDGTKLVFGEAHRDAVYELSGPASATEVRFDAPATLVGEPLTMLPPAVISGDKGAVLNPLAGSDGLCVGFDCEMPTFFASKTERRLLWRGVQLANVSSVAGYLCGSWGGAGKARPDYVFFAKADDGKTATVQFQAWQIEQWTRTVLLSLEQDGDDVYATLVWAKYSSDRSSNGQDWLKNPSAATSGTHGDYAQFSETATGTGIGVTDVSPVFDTEMTLSGVFPSGTVRANLGKMIIEPQSNLSIDNPFSGQVSEVVYRNTFGDWQTFSLPGQWVGTDEILVSEDTSVGSIEVLGVYFCGTAVNVDCNSNPELMRNIGVWSDMQGSVRKVQLQYHDYQSADNDWTKAVNLEFRQDGRKVYMKAVSTCYQRGDVRGTHIAETSTLPCTSGNPNDRGHCNGGYGLYSFTFRHRSGDWGISFDGDSRNEIVKGACFTLDGFHNAICRNDHAFPSRSSLVLTNDTYLTLACGSGSFGAVDNAVADPFTVVVGDGCALETTKDWQIGSQMHVHLLGGRLTQNSTVYLNWLVLADGACVEMKGKRTARVGYYKGNTCYQTLPGTDCTIGSALVGVRRSSADYRNVHVFDLGADLHVTCPIADCTEPGMRGLNWEKTGPATLYLEASASTWTFTANTVSTEGAFDICEGTLACRADHVLSGVNPISLKGGTLDAGTHGNAFGPLTVSSDSAIALDDGAQLTFADSTAGAWSGKLAITGPWDELKAGHLRFGTSVAGLTAEQLRHIRYNDTRRAHLDENGWLTTVPMGLTVIFK